MTTLTAAASPAAAVSGQVETVLASLPVSLGMSGPGPRPADLTAVDGTAGWPDLVRGALSGGTRGALVVEPVPVTDDALQDLPDAPVVVDRRFAGNPALDGAAELFAAWPADALIECHAYVADESELPRTLLDQLAVLRRLGRPMLSLRELVWHRTGYVAEGRTRSGSPVLFTTAVTTGEPSAARVRGLSTDVVVEVTLPDSRTAQPATVVRTTSDGAVQLPTVWETSHRATWRRLRDAVLHGHNTSDLADLRADLALAGQVLPPA
jgi:hypothetical protein